MCSFSGVSCSLSTIFDGWHPQEVTYNLSVLQLHFIKRSFCVIHQHFFHISYSCAVSSGNTHSWMCVWENYDPCFLLNIVNLLLKTCVCVICRLTDGFLPLLFHNQMTKDNLCECLPRDWVNRTELYWLAALTFQSGIVKRSQSRQHVSTQIRAHPEARGCWLHETAEINLSLHSELITINFILLMIGAQNQSIKSLG